MSNKPIKGRKVSAVLWWCWECGVYNLGEVALDATKEFICINCKKIYAIDKYSYDINY